MKKNNTIIHVLFIMFFVGFLYSSMITRSVIATVTLGFFTTFMLLIELYAALEDEIDKLKK